MKMTQKLCAAAMVATFGAAVLAPSIVLAAPEWSAEGTITFTEDTTEPPVTPPGITEPEITEPEVNPDNSPLRIVSVTPLNFASQQIAGNDSNKVYPATVFSAPKADEDGEPTEEMVDMPHFVRFLDRRADGEENHYTISAKITNQFTNTENADKELAGATIAYSNVTLVTGTNNATKPSSAVIKPSFELSVDDAATIVTQNEADKGYGVFEIMFGNLANNTAAKSVNLKVPGTNVIQAGEYVGEVTWFISDAR